MQDATRGQCPSPTGARVAGVLERYHRRLHAFVTARLGRYDWHLADDLTSRALEQAAHSLPLVRVPEHLVFGWLAGIARHVIADQYRRARMTRRLVTDHADAARARSLPPVRPVEDQVLARAALLKRVEGVAA